MKRHILPLFTFTFALHLPLFASPFAPEPAVELVVYSPIKSESALHVETVEKDPAKPAKRWTFPSSYTGHRAVCIIPGATTNDSFCAWTGGDAFKPGDPFGTCAGRDYPVIDFSKTSAITPRIDVFTDMSDRFAVFGHKATEDRVRHILPSGTVARVRVVRAAIDGLPVDKIGVEPRVVLDRTFDQDRRTFLHEGDFLANGEMDIDWSAFLADLSNIDQQEYMLTNVTYRVVIGDGSMAFEQTAGDKEDTNTVITALGTMIERRFEASRTVPTPATDGCIFNRAQPTFAWALSGEDPYAARFGTTYTAFKVVVKDGATKVYESPITRLPVADTKGVYSWTAPLYVDAPSPSNPNVIFNNLSNYTWQVYVYNAKFKRDMNPSAAMTFRMNVPE